MHVVIAGSSGFLGSHLRQELRDRGHDVTRLVRRPPNADDERRWDPYSGALGVEALESADAVVNLAGSPTAGNPHSGRWASDLRRSRVTTTRVLAEAIAACRTPPAFIAGNAMGYYGDHGDQRVTEEASSTGGSLLSSVCRDWQEATGAASSAGARVCVLRSAPVLDRSSAPVKQLLPLFRLGLGARMGGGRQYFPVVSLRDWVGAVCHLLEHPTASGPVNVCCPVTPTNREFTDALAQAVGRRARLAVPATPLRAAVGSLAPELLGSIRAEPAALTRLGYGFSDVDVRDVVASALG